MSLFVETAWENDAVGDKLSKDLFSKKKKKKKQDNGKAKKSGKKPLEEARRNIRAVAVNASSKSTKIDSQKRKRSIIDLGESAVKKSKKQLLSEKVKPVSQVANVSPKAETKSQRRRNKLKMKKRLEVQEDTRVKSPGKSLNVERIEKLLAMKEAKMSSGKNRRIGAEPEPEMCLRDRMMAQLRASRFRFLNETLYNNESSESRKYFKEDPEAFAAYHTGYRQQVEQWPVNPLDVVISSIKKMPKDHVVADFGCGEARLAESVPQKVHSFDLVAVNDRVKACDMAHTPLLTNGANVVVFCLSLMGTNLADYLLEANRVLKKDGILKIADVESRFENVQDFIKLLESYGFTNTWKDLSHNLFYFMDFKKMSEVTRKSKNLPEIILKSCLYKKR